MRKVKIHFLEFYRNGSSALKDTILATVQSPGYSTSDPSPCQWPEKAVDNG